VRQGTLGCILIFPPAGVTHFGFRGRTKIGVNRAIDTFPIGLELQQSSPDRRKVVDLDATADATRAEAVRTDTFDSHFDDVALVLAELDVDRRWKVATEVARRVRAGEHT
jgi:hypothetical protein